MASYETFEEPEGTAATVANTCPRWCVTEHGVQLGEEDWIHTSPAVMVADGLMARMCVSIDPDTGIEDGPYVLIGGSELTADETKAVGESLIRLANFDGHAH
jgi:hypothetical protein